MVAQDVVVDSTVTAEDLLAVQALGRKETWSYYRVLGALAAAALVNLVLRALDVDSIYPWLFDLYVVLLTGLAVYAHRKSQREHAEKTAARNRERSTMRFDPEGVTYRDELTGTRHRWARFSRVVDLPKAYFLETNPGTGYVLPKRGFADAGDEAMFRSMAQAAGLRLGPP